MAQFALENLSFTYPGASAPAVDNVTLSVSEGSYVVLCGKSGCGKTTLLRHLKTALEPHGTRSGTVLFEGRPLVEVPQREQTARIGFVMQDPEAQVVTDKVWHELAFGLESLGCDQRTMRLRVAEMASYFGIQDWFHRDVRDLSGGQKQLLNLASVMAMQPHCLVLDEPTSQLDPIAASNFLDTVRRINRELGMTVILSEHRLEQVFPAADRVIVMERGRVALDGNPRAVGEELCRSGHELSLAAPAPLRIYEEVCGAESEDVAATGAFEARAARAFEADDSSDSAPVVPPLTVREGRLWLSRYVRQQPPAHSAPQHADPPLSEDFEPVVEAKEVWLRYDRNAPDVLRGVNLRVPAGVLQAVVGGNGAGKSTLLRALCGVAKPYRGTIRIAGRKINTYRGNSLYRGVVAMLPQDPSTLFLHKTVREDLLEQAQDQGASAEEARAEVDAVAARLEIERIMERHPFDLSGGELQRAAIAKVLLAQPRILLLDEPTKGIDQYLKERLARLFAELKAEGVTIIMASHDIEFCARYADRVSMFFDGSVTATDTPHRFFSSNAFYTTAANRMARGLFPQAVTDEEVVALCR